MLILLLLSAGVASYYNYQKKDGTLLKDVAWYVDLPLTLRFPTGSLSPHHRRYYPQPKKGAEQVADRVAFYVGKQGLKLGSPPMDA